MRHFGDDFEPGTWDTAGDVFAVDERHERIGGPVDDERRHANIAQTLGPSVIGQDGEQLSPAASRLQQLEAEQKKLLTQLKVSKNKIAASEAKPEQQPDPQPERAPVSGTDLMLSAQAILRREAEIFKRIEDENARPKRKSVTPSTREVEYAMYFKQWADKVEKTGNNNYPEAARGRTLRLVMTVSVLADGSIEKVEVDRTSGVRAVDNAARNIVKLAAPYGRFSPEMRARYGVLDLTMSWTFSSGEELSVETSR